LGASPCQVFTTSPQSPVTPCEISTSTLASWPTPGQAHGQFRRSATYHFYYGDETGRPGTILTFFPWEQADKGRGGIGKPANRLPHSRTLAQLLDAPLIEKGVAHEAVEKRFGESVLPFSDPDGMSLALVGVPGADNEPAWSSGEIAWSMRSAAFMG